MNIKNIDVQLLRRIVTDIKNECSDRVVDIILYGSYVKGTATKESDIDVLVILKGTLEKAEDFENVPVADYETMWKRHNRLIHLCYITENDYLEGKEKEFRDVPNYGISIMSILEEI